MLEKGIRYKSEYEENRDFKWKDGVSFRLAPLEVNKEGDLKLTIFNSVNDESVEAGETILRLVSHEEEVKSVSIVSFTINRENEGNGANLIECVNSFLDSKSLAGYLSNYIGLLKKGTSNSPDNLKDGVKKDLYKNHGWQGNLVDRSMYRDPKGKDLIK
jgi:hypothetical protein